MISFGVFRIATQDPDVSGIGYRVDATCPCDCFRQQYGLSDFIDSLMTYPPVYRKRSGPMTRKYDGVPWIERIQFHVTRFEARKI